MKLNALQIASLALHVQAAIRDNPPEPQLSSDLKPDGLIVGQMLPWERDLKFRIEHDKHLPPYEELMQVEIADFILDYFANTQEVQFGQLSPIEQDVLDAGGLGSQGLDEARFEYLNRILDALLADTQFKPKTQFELTPSRIWYMQAVASRGAESPIKDFPDREDHATQALTVALRTSLRIGPDGQQVLSDISVVPNTSKMMTEVRFTVEEWVSQPLGKSYSADRILVNGMVVKDRYEAVPAQRRQWADDIRTQQEPLDFSTWVARYGNPGQAEPMLDVRRTLDTSDARGDEFEPQ